VAGESFLAANVTSLVLLFRGLQSKKAMTEKATLLDNFCYAMRQMQFLDRRPPELKAEIFELLFESANISKFTPEEKLKYDKDMTTERDRRNQLATSFSDGKDEGLAEGMESKPPVKTVLEF